MGEFSTVITEALKGQGIWTICAVCLVIYVLKTSGDRENKLHSLIDELAKNFRLMEDVKDDVEEIKEKLK